ncbi:MAG: rhodanese-like domain-containing protein [Candidatus Kapaibacteriota bacterium]
MNLKNLSLNQKLGVLALILGLIALFTHDPTKATYMRIDPKELSLEINSPSKFIAPVELAEEIISGHEFFTLVDLRNPSEYEKGTIPGAINLSAKDLFESYLQRNQKIILFSEEDTKALNAWIALKSQGYKNVLVLKGGYQGWQNEVLFPKISSDTTKAGKEKLEKIKQISNYFGGTPILISEGKGIPIQTETRKATTMQQQTPAPAVKKPGGTAKPKREGC